MSRVKQEEQAIIEQMVADFYEDLIHFRVTQLDEPHKYTQSHKQLNPVESIDDDKREPTKPKLSEDEK